MKALFLDLRKCKTLRQGAFIVLAIVPSLNAAIPSKSILDQLLSNPSSYQQEDSAEQTQALFSRTLPLMNQVSTFAKRQEALAAMVSDAAILFDVQNHLNKYDQMNPEDKASYASRHNWINFAARKQVASLATQKRFQIFADQTYSTKASKLFKFFQNLRAKNPKFNFSDSQINNYIKSILAASSDSNVDSLIENLVQDIENFEKINSKEGVEQALSGIADQLNSLSAALEGSGAASTEIAQFLKNAHDVAGDDLTLASHQQSLADGAIAQNSSSENFLGDLSKISFNDLNLKGFNREDPLFSNEADWGNPEGGGQLMAAADQSSSDVSSGGSTPLLGAAYVPQSQERNPATETPNAEMDIRTRDYGEPIKIEGSNNNGTKSNGGLPALTHNGATPHGGATANNENHFLASKGSTNSAPKEIEAAPKATTPIPVAKPIENQNTSPDWAIKAAEAEAVAKGLTGAAKDTFVKSQSKDLESYFGANDPSNNWDHVPSEPSIPLPSGCPVVSNSSFTKVFQDLVKFREQELPLRQVSNPELAAYVKNGILNEKFYKDTLNLYNAAGKCLPSKLPSPNNGNDIEDFLFLAEVMGYVSFKFQFHANNSNALDSKGCPMPAAVKDAEVGNEANRKALVVGGVTTLLYATYNRVGNDVNSFQKNLVCTEDGVIRTKDGGQPLPTYMADNRIKAGLDSNQKLRPMSYLLKKCSVSFQQINNKFIELTRAKVATHEANLINDKKDPSQARIAQCQREALLNSYFTGVAGLGPMTKPALAPVVGDANSPVHAPAPASVSPSVPTQ